MEASRLTGFSGNQLDRRSESRAETCVAEALADPSARLYLMRSGRVYFHLEGGKPAAKWRAGEAAAIKARLEHAVLLGHGAEGPVLAAPAGLEPEELPDSIKAIDLRSVYAQGLADELGEIAQGASLLAWHSANRFCGKCGQPTEMRGGGVKRFCTACESEHFPRTDPVAIMLAVDGGRCLLGRGRHFPPGMFSCLAGFIEQGETIEDAVRRETLEESGISIGRVAYHASQPWPFPHSLMIGCYGEALSTDIVPDDAELEAVRWFSKAEVRAVLAGENSDGIHFPPPAAIASLLVRHWAEAA